MRRLPLTVATAALALLVAGLPAGGVIGLDGTADAAVAVVAQPAPGAEQPDDADAPDEEPAPTPPERHDIVITPDAETPATEAGDRGGSLQIGLLGVVLAGVGAIVALATRDARRSRRRRAPAATSSAAETRRQ